MDQTRTQSALENVNGSWIADRKTIKKMDGLRGARWRAGPHGEHFLNLFFTSTRTPHLYQLLGKKFL